MAQKNRTARPAARKHQPNSKSNKKTVARSSSKREPIAQVVERVRRRPVVGEQPKLKGELPVPTATFYF
jgi:hypothetical protein